MGMEPLFPAILVAFAAALGAFMPFRRAALVWFGDFLDWEDEHGGRRLGVNYPSPKHIGAATSLILAFWGGSAVLGGGGGVEPPPSYSAPNTPTADVVVFAATGDSARVVGTAFVGSLDDTHDSTQIQVDTAGGTFASPQYHNVSLGAVTTDTVAALDSGAVAKARMRYKGVNGGWSAWSDSVQFTATAETTWNLDSNLPAGLTLRTYNDHSTSWGTGWSYASSGGGGRVTRISDGTAPSPITLTGQSSDTNADSSVINQDWEGVGDGQSNDFLYWDPPGGADHIFLSTVIYYSSEMVPTNEVKTLEWLLDGSSAWLGVYPAGDDKNPGSFDQLVFVSRAGGDTVTEPVGDTVAIPVDQWAKVQYEVRLSPVRVRVWINDVLAHQESAGMSFGSSTAFSEFQQSPVWGGGNGVSAPAGALIKYAATAIWTN